MRFRFSLEPALRVAQIREECEERKLQAVQVVIASIVREMEAARQAQLRLRRSPAPEACTSAAWRWAAQQEIAGLELHERRLRLRLVSEEKALVQQQHAYVLARQKAEALRRLRETQHEAFRRDLLRREQRAIDDTFLNRYR
jgi:flagellar export protein FliJ